MKELNLIALSLLTFAIFQSCNIKTGKEMENNKVTWFSIPSDNLERSTKFYNDVFGWKIQKLTEEENSDFDYYTMLNSESDENFVSNDRGSINGCIVKRKIGLPTPAVLVNVENLDDAMNKVRTAGGEVVTEKIKMKSLDGVFVLIKDPEGNYVELFQPL